MLGVCSITVKNPSTDTLRVLYGVIAQANADISTIHMVLTSINPISYTSWGAGRVLLRRIFSCSVLLSACVSCCVSAENMVPGDWSSHTADLMATVQVAEH